MTTTLPFPTGDSVMVFRDDPMWGTRAKWFMHPAAKLTELHVATYDLAVDNDGEPIDPMRDIEFIEREHPGCVYVY